MSKQLTEGWKWIIESRKWHYFRNGRSLCGRWATLSNAGFETGNDDSPDNCAECKRKIMAQAAKTEKM